MAPSARNAQQQDTCHFLSKVEGDLRELTRCHQQGSRPQEVQAVLMRLQQHREHIRQRSSAKGVDKALQAKLAAARAKIEEGMRKSRELEKRCRADTPQQPTSPGTSIVPSPRCVASAPNSRIAQRCDSTSSCNSTIGKFEADVEEVKVLAEQLVADVAGEGGDLMSEFVCKICQTHVVGCQPKLTRCSHLFCGDCISKWFAVQPGCQSWAGRAKGAGSVPCPVCKEPLRADKDLHPVCKGGQGGSAFLWQMLSATRIVCANHPKCNKQGCCDWEGDYGSYQEHIRTCANAPCCAATLASPSSRPVDSEEVEVSIETIAGSSVSDDVKDCLESKPSSEFSSTAPSLRESGDAMSETESEQEDMAPFPVALDLPVNESSEAEPRIEIFEDLGCTAAVPAEDLKASAQDVASEQEPDLYSLIAQLVELKASSSPVQAQQRPSLTSTPAGLEVTPTSQISEPVLVQGLASPQGLPTAALSSTSRGSEKTMSKSKDARPKCSPGALAAAQLQAQAAAFQMQANAARAAQVAYSAQWQAAWQMQAAHAMQWQQAGMAYAGRMAQWQLAQKQAAQAAWAMQTARR
mmetsp:Transcript_21591/g.54016  ORF Transcript_21591/g.54016 Transcript_21591/m.54016 type:complete len:579 (-) Transcript_21591:91-1827(-)